MGRYLNEVRRHEKKIRHYYDHAGSRGYSQAIYYFSQLAEIMVRASRSTKNQGEVPIIHSIYKSVQSLMDEMKRREEADN